MLRAGLSVFLSFNAVSDKYSIQVRLHQAIAMNVSIAE